MKIERIMMIRPGKRVPRMAFAQPIGLLYIISVLREKYPGRFQFELVEQAIYNLSTEEVRQRFLEFNPDLVAFSAMSVDGNELMELSRMVKEEKHGCLTIVGGPYASSFQDWILSVDIVVPGEGERTFPELLDNLIADEPLDRVKGIAFKKNGQIVRTEPREFIENLDLIPFPAWDLIDFNKYSVELSMNYYCHSTPWAIMFTSRACPYQCVYCHKIFGNKFRKRSVENIIKEIELLVNKYGIKEIHIVDDIFNIDITRAKKICDEIVSRGIKIKIAFPNGLRADLMDRDLIKKLKDAGCYAITYAVETASPRLQKIIRKNLDLKKTKEVIAWTYEEGIIPQAFVMLGFPGETVEEMNMTIDYTLDTKLLKTFYFAVVVYPSTELMEIAKKLYPDFDFSHYSLSGLWFWLGVPFYTRVTGTDLFKIIRYAHLRFLFRPSIIIKILWMFPKNIFMLRGIYGGLRMVFIPLNRIESAFKNLRRK